MALLTQDDISQLQADIEKKKAQIQDLQENILNIPNVSNKITDLRPVSFAYKEDETHALHYGLIAEEVEEIFPELVIYENGVPDAISYQFLPILLLKDLQDTKTETADTKTEITDTKTELADTKAELEATKDRLSTVEAQLAAALADIAAIKSALGM